MIIKDRETLKKVVEELKKQGKIIVTTNGVFDIIHPGHIASLREAKKHGDILIVLLNSDESVRKIKGPQRPILPLEYRMLIVDSIKYVDIVSYFDEETPEKILEDIRPHVHVKGPDYKGKTLPEKAVVEKYGGKVVIIDHPYKIHTSKIIDEIVRRFKE